MRTATIRTALLTMAFGATMLGTAGTADAAQNYRRDGWFWNYYNERWCLTENNSMAPDCGYRTFQQCNYSRNGTGGSCNENPGYVAQVSPSKRVKRAHR